MPNFKPYQFPTDISWNGILGICSVFGPFSWTEALVEVSDTCYRRYLVASCPGPITPDMFAEAGRLPPWQIAKRFLYYGKSWIGDLTEVSQGTLESARLNLEDT